MNGRAGQLQLPRKLVEVFSGEALYRAGDGGNYSRLVVPHGWWGFHLQGGYKLFLAIWLIIVLLVANLAWADQQSWAQQPQADMLDQAAAAQFQALATQLGNASEAVQKLIDSRKKLQQDLEALKSLKSLKPSEMPEAPKP